MLCCESKQNVADSRCTLGFFLTFFFLFPDPVYDSVSGEKIIGRMTVTVEAAEALRSLMQD